MPSKNELHRFSQFFFLRTFVWTSLLFTIVHDFRLPPCQQPWHLSQIIFHTRQISTLSSFIFFRMWPQKNPNPKCRFSRRFTGTEFTIAIAPNNQSNFISFFYVLCWFNLATRRGEITSISFTDSSTLITTCSFNILDSRTTDYTDDGVNFDAYLAMPHEHKSLWRFLLP